MTSTPVRNADSLMNLVGKTAQTTFSGIKNAGGTSFGDVMGKTPGSNETAAAAQTVKKTGNTGESIRDKLGSAGKSTQTLKPKNGVKEEKDTGALEDAVTKAGQELAASVAREMNVSEAAVEAAMDELSLTAADLLNAEKLTELVVALSGADDSMALLTDEGLYDNVQNLLTQLFDVKEGLMEEFSLSPQELTQSLAELQEIPEQVTEDVTGMKNTENAVPEENVRTADVPEESARMDGTITIQKEGMTEETVSEKHTGEHTSHEDGKQETGSRGQHMGEAAPVHNNVLLQKETEAPLQMQESAAYAESSTQTQEIMDQIMDYMKVQLKPEMDQLEMQLHPETLGTLKIQLVSKGGEVTAHFQVQNESVRAAIESQMTVLKNTLEEQGVKIEAVEVTVESHAFESNLYKGQDRGNENLYQDKKKARRRLNLNALSDDFEETAEEEERLAASMMKANGTTVDYTA